MVLPGRWSITGNIAPSIGDMMISRWWWAGGGALAVVLLGVAAFVKVPQLALVQSEHTAHVGELTGPLLVGQTFVAPENNLSGVAVQFATYSGRNNTKPVRFGLREWRSKQDVRTAHVMASALGDNQLYRFDFEPLADSAGRTYFFYVTSLESVPGDAVTVDVDARDPYPSGTAFIGQMETLHKSGKAKVDVTFALYHAVPLRVAVIGWLAAWWHGFELDRAWLPGLLAAVIVTLVWWGADRIKTRRALMLALGGSFVAALGWRWWYAKELPLTNDEGNYLYDAWALLHGKLAGGDGYVKAPLVIAWVAGWQWLFGHTVLAGRVSSIIISSLTLWPLYVLGSSLWNRRVGLVAAALWAVTGVAVVFGIYIHTQPVALFFAVAGIALLARLRQGSGGQARYYFAAGILLGLGVASRKSVLAVGLVPLVMLLASEDSWPKRLWRLVWVGAGFLVVLAVFLFLAYGMYGPIGVREAIGIGSAEDSISADPAEAEQVREYSIRGMTPFFRESLPLILLSLLGLGMAGERLFRTKLAWLAPAAVGWWAWWFFFEYEGSVFYRFGILEMWYLFAAVLLLVALWPERKSEKIQLANYAAVPLWVLGLIIFYTNWIKFHANYIAEFIPPLVVLSAFGAVALREPANSASRRLPRYLGVIAWGVAMAAIIVTGYVTFVFEHTGTFQQDAVAEAAAWAKENIPTDQAIFTGAAAIPYVSGHRVALDIAHPRWYAYEFTRKDPARLNTFLPPAEKMIEAFQQSEWVLMEQQTSFSFPMEYSGIEKSIKQDFVLVHSVENGSNGLKFYQRRH